MTKDTEKAFVIIYSEYLRRRSIGTAKYLAVRFEGSKLNSIDAFSCWHPEDIRYSLQELRKLGFVKIDIIGDVTLQESGIGYMESRPREYFSSFAGIVTGLVELIAAFLPL